ncbi:hypothetical protein TNCV_1949101 [Trichonephila clavipes]|nr:hypothetical protein TNCV_1949101 [Trichonephila clavipes]
MVQARNMDLMRKSICGFQGKAPRVCCPTKDDDDAWTPETDDPLIQDLGRGFTQQPRNALPHSDKILNAGIPSPAPTLKGVVKTARSRRTLFPSVPDRNPRNLSCQGASFTPAVIRSLEHHAGDSTIWFHSTLTLWLR